MLNKTASSDENMDTNRNRTQDLSAVFTTRPPQGYDILFDEKQQDGRNLLLKCRLTFLFQPNHSLLDQYTGCHSTIFPI